MQLWSEQLRCNLRDLLTQKLAGQVEKGSVPPASAPTDAVKIQTLEARVPIMAMPRSTSRAGTRFDALVTP
ncbi:hypothetical protein XF36_28870 (plasmid) [Pseudonocardia sp. HH130629-09]|nr:hypothetical protein XF36_28870 [Pseudonocardia sp. HH130629-09]